MDEEYKVIDAVCGKEGSREDGKVIWVCVTEKGQRFNVRSQGTMEERAKLYEDREQYIGEMLKVKFFEKTVDGKPRFPIGIGWRAEEDMPDPKE